MRVASHNTDAMRRYEQAQEAALEAAQRSDMRLCVDKCLEAVLSAPYKREENRWPLFDLATTLLTARTQCPGLEPTGCNDYSSLECINKDETEPIIFR